MSIHLMAKAWRLDLPQGQKFLLVALCDHANDDGVCWPGQDSLSKKCSMNEKTIGRHIEWLESRGYLKSQRRQEGRKRLSDCYFIDLDAPQEPDNLEPSKLEPDNLEPSKISPMNPTICPHEPDNLEPSFNDEPSIEPSVNRQSRVRATRLPENWQPSDSLIIWTRQKAPHWTPEKFGFVLEKFKNYWLAASGRSASKLDWDATWRNWVLSDLEREPGAKTQSTLYQRNQAAAAEAKRRLFGDVA